MFRSFYFGNDGDFITCSLQSRWNFLLELGTGFAFIDEQYLLVVNEDEFYVNLLFYNYKLHCFVAIDLKTGKFTPEMAGKMNFYLSALNVSCKSVKGEIC